MVGPQIPTFLDNVEAFVERLGPMHAPIVIDLAQLPWQTSGQRDEFIDTLTGG